MPSLKKIYNVGDTIKVRRYSQTPSLNGKLLTLYLGTSETEGCVLPQWSEKHQLWLVRALRVTNGKRSTSPNYYWFTEDVID
jgi:hypothetical protein